ncbi:MAG: recombinase family protein [Halobacteriota archaeon]
MEAYCIAKDWQLAGVETDKGYSAKDMNRPGAQVVLDAVNAGDIDAIVVYKLDRLTRSITDLNDIILLLNAKNVASVSIEENIDATTATGRFMLNVLISISQWEREVIGERTKEAINSLKDNQKVYNGPVYGFDAPENVLYPNEAEQDAIKYMHDLRECGKSYRAIAAELNAAGLSTKKGGKWQLTTVRNVLMRTLETA